RPMTRKIIGFALAVLVLIVAAVNFLVSGAYFWIVVYLVAAIFIVLAAYGRIPVFFLAVACVACFISAFYVWSGHLDNPEPFDGNVWQLEEAREATCLLGLGMILFLYALMPG